MHPGGESGSADTVRDPRGFAVKFYTNDGLWDLTGNTIPIFFIRDPMFVSSTTWHYVNVHVYWILLLLETLSLEVLDCLKG